MLDTMMGLLGGAEPVQVVDSSRPTQGARVFMGEGLLPVPSKLVGSGGGNLWKCLNSCWSCKCLDGMVKQAPTVDTSFKQTLLSYIALNVCTYIHM